MGKKSKGKKKKAMEEELKEKQKLEEEAAARKKAEAEGPSLDSIPPDEMIDHIMQSVKSSNSVTRRRKSE